MERFLPEGRLIETVENKAALRSKSTLLRAMEEKRILEARAVLCDTEHNLIVDLGCMQGIIKREEGAIGLDTGLVKDIAVISRVNKPVCFYIVGFDETGAVLSRKAVQQDCREQYIKRLIPGDIIDARITHLESFGAFADIGCGIPSLIPIDSISVSRISHPKDRFLPSMDIRAVVKSIDSCGRICLSQKELLGTWAQNATLFSQGETVAGIIRSVEPYGIFVELTPNLAGLAEPKEGVRVGQQASVYIKSLIPEKMKIKLIIVDSFDGKTTPHTPQYFYEGNRLNYFRYSPECCSKVIETVFLKLLKAV